jgi:hypothetical protein
MKKIIIFVRLQRKTCRPNLRPSQILSHAKSVLKELLYDFHRKIKKYYSQIKDLAKLKGYNNYSHQIAFEMEETQVKKIVYKRKPRGVC